METVEIENDGSRADRGTVGNDHGSLDNRSTLAEEIATGPHVAIATRGHVAKVVSLATERKKRAKVATKRQPHVATGKPYVEAVKASKGTWAFRVRWYENGHRVKPVYISRVADPVYEIIRQGDYGKFKKQLIASHFSGAVQAGH